MAKILRDSGASRKETLWLKQTDEDVWSLKEKYFLAAAVARSGNGNWVSVSRLLKQSFEKIKDERPPDWFSTKNCALQYSKLQEEITAPERKKKRRLTTEDESPQQKKIEKIESHEEAIVRVLKEKRLQEALTHYDELKAYLAQMEKLNFIYHDSNTNEKEKSDAFEAAKRILEEESKKKTARIRWMKERDDQRKSHQVQTDRHIKKHIEPALEKAVSEGNKGHENSFTGVKAEIEVSNKTLGEAQDSHAKSDKINAVQEIKNDLKSMPEDSNRCDEMVEVKMESTLKSDLSISTCEDGPMTELPIPCNEITCSSGSDMPHILDAPISNSNPEEAERVHEDEPVLMSTTDVEIEIIKDQNVVVAKPETECQESKSNGAVTENKTESVLEKETDGVNELMTDIEQDVLEKNFENNDRPNETSSNHSNGTRYIIPKLLEMSKYEKAKKSDSDNSRSSTPKRLTSSTSVDLQEFESGDERKEILSKHRRSGRKSDASFGTTLDSDTFKAFRKGALTLLNNLHFQRSFTKLMPKAKDLKGSLHTEVKSFTSIRFDVEAGLIRTMEELQWNILHTLSSMALFYRFNQKEFRETQQLYKDFNGMMKKHLACSDDSISAPLSSGLKQRRSSAMSDIESKRRKT